MHRTTPEQARSDRPRKSREGNGDSLALLIDRFGAEVDPLSEDEIDEHASCSGTNLKSRHQ